MLPESLFPLLAVKVTHPEPPGDLELKLVVFRRGHSSPAGLCKPVCDHVDFGLVLPLLLVIRDLALLIDADEVSVLEGSDRLGSFGKRIFLRFWIQFLRTSVSWRY